MTTLGTFALIIEADTKKVTAGVKTATSDAKVLNNEFANTGKVLDEAGGSMSGLAMAAGKVLGAFVGLAAARAAIANFTEGAIAAGKFSETIGVNIEDMQAWEATAKNMGASGESLKSALAGITKGAQDAERFSFSKLADDLHQLGINALDSAGKAKTAQAILLELANSEKYKTASPTLKRAYVNELGISEDLIPMLSQGGDAITAFVGKQKLIGTYSKQNAIDAQAYEAAMQDLKRAWEQVSNGLVNSALPTLKAIAMALQTAGGWAKAHEGTVKGLAVAFSALLLPSVLAATQALLLMAAAFLATPIGLLVAGIGLLAVGIGALYDKSEAFRDLWGSMFSIDAVTAFFTSFAQIAARIIDGVLNKFKSLGNLLKDMGILSGAHFEMDTLSKGFDKNPPLPLPNTPNFVNAQQPTNELLNNANAQLRYANTPLNAMTSNSISATNNSQRSVQLHVAKIEVNTNATDGEGTARALQKSLNDEMSSAIQYFNSGIAL